MEELWSSHKEIIRYLYLVKGMTRQDVMSKMEDDYEFRASAGQYERQFKKWGFRKNLTPSEWQLVSRRIDKRKRDGKETDLKIHGIRVPPKKVDKAISRYGQGSAFDNARERFRSPTPPTGVSFSPQPTYSLSPDLYTLPWQAISSSVSSLFHANPEFLQRLSGTLVGPSSASRRSLTRACVPKLDANVTMSFPRASDVPVFADFIFSAFVATNHIRDPSKEYDDPELSRPSVVRALCTLRAPNVLQILKALKLKDEPVVDALSHSLFKEALLSQNVGLTAMLLKTSVFDVADLLPGPWPKDDLRSSIQTLPRRNSQDARPPLQVAIETGNIKLVRILIDHGADVNIVGAGGCDMFRVAATVPSEDILDLLLESVQGISLPYLRACLAHGLFDHASRIWPQIKGLTSVHEKLETEMLTGAVRAGHIPFVKDLLENGADPNAFNKAYESPLQLASESDGDCLAIAKILVEWGADLDFRFDDGDGNLRMPTPLQNAARRNNLAVAAFLIDEGADPNAKVTVDSMDNIFESRTFGSCTLNLALQAKSDTRMIEMLLEAGANPDDSTLSHALRYHSDPQAFQLLMRYGAPISSELFLSAAPAGNIWVVQLCLDAGANLNKIHNGKTALGATLIAMIFASESSGVVNEQLWEMCTFLLERGADVNIHSSRPPLSYALEITARTGQRHLVEHFLSRGAHCDNPDVLEEAVGTRDPIVLERILDAAATRPGFKGAFMSSCLGHGALCMAAKKNDVGATKSLVSRGVNLKSACATRVLQSACESARTQSGVIEVLLSGGVPTNFSQCCGFDRCGPSYYISHLHPVQLLARAGDAEGVQSLLNYGADPNLYGSVYDFIADEDSQIYISILSSAAAGGHPTIVKELLKAGAETNLPARGKFGRTPLQSAAQCGHIDVVELLIDEGANVNAEPAEYAGVTALQAAAIRGFVGIAAKLIEHGADVNAPASKKAGRTALEGACEHGRVDMVEFLVQAGADLRAAQYKNALVFARKNGFGAVARLLERRREDLKMDEFVNFPA